MPILTVVFGLLLVMLGVMSGQQAGQIHGYIPAFFGAAFVILGAVGHLVEGARRHVMHVAAAIALLGFFGTIDGLIGMIRWGLGGDAPMVPAMARAKAIMSVLSLIYEAMCVRSFIMARRARGD